jgi:hypothetical protein
LLGELLANLTLGVIGQYQLFDGVRQIGSTVDGPVPLVGQLFQPVSGISLQTVMPGDA